MTFFNFSHWASSRQKEGKKQSLILIKGVKTLEKIRIGKHLFTSSVFQSVRFDGATIFGLLEFIKTYYFLIYLSSQNIKSTKRQNARNNIFVKKGAKYRWIIL
jgi:hypothetical protein